MDVNNCWGRGGVEDSAWWNDTHDPNFCHEMVQAIKKHSITSDYKKEMYLAIEKEIHALSGLHTRVLTGECNQRSPAPGHGKLHVGPASAAPSAGVCTQGTTKTNGGSRCGHVRCLWFGQAHRLGTARAHGVQAESAAVRGQLVGGYGPRVERPA